MGTREYMRTVGAVRSPTWASPASRRRHPSSRWIGWRASGESVTAPADGFVVFPNTKAERGAEWCYFAQRVKRL